MYCGYIVELHNLRKHSNADRLQCVEVFGNNIIVDLSYQEGQKVVFFPVDGRLGDEYAETNNLIRKKDENGNNIGGYLEPGKNNIKALKLRGEKSEGLVLPIETLSKYISIEELNVGDKITTLNGHLICEKYIPKKRTSQSMNSRTSKNKKENYGSHFPIFKEHEDTEQLMFNKAAFKEGDKCTITLKVHGCFSAISKIKLWGKDRGVRIKDIKPGDVVIGYKDGKLVPSKVIATYINGTTKEWRELKISRIGMSGEEYTRIECTPEHLFYDYKEDKYIPAQQLKEGEKFYTIKKTPILTHKHKEILLGLYLGDGYYLQKERVGNIQSGQKAEHEEYLDYIVNIFDGLFYKDKKLYISGYGSPVKRIKSKYAVAIKAFFNEILSEDKDNKLTEKIIPYFTNLSLAFLYMDDGSLSHNDKQRDRASLAICDYNDHDADIISLAIKSLGYDNTLYKDPKGYNRIRLLTDDSQRMFKNISRYVPPIMRYKLPVGIPNDFKEQVIPIEEGYMFIENKILSNSPKHYKKGKIKYDLHTETNNYVVQDCLVHNSSGRTAYSIEETDIKQNFLQKLLKKPVQKHREWTYVSGTRRVVLEDYDGGYYGSNEFRHPWHDFFKGKLEKGETAYYEIAGYVNETTPIMGTCSNSKLKDKELKKLYGDKMEFTYGCKPGENRIFVYRMTMTNEDGYVVEYPDWLMRLRCEMMGAECVPLFETFTFTTWEDLMERVEKYYDGPDLIGKTHIREGVVVRIENRKKFTAFKHKNFTFKLVEGIVKDEAETPNMEEAQELISEAGEA